MHQLRFYLRFLRLTLLIGLGLGYALWFALRARTLGVSLGQRQQATSWFLGLLTRCLPFRIQVQGQQPKQPALWVSNHVSWTDIPLLGQFAPISFLSKAEVQHWPIAGTLTKESATLFIQRGQGNRDELRQQLVYYLRHGHHLAIFPEGTTTDGSQVRTFHSRLLGCLDKTGTPVQPIAIRYLRAGKTDTEIAPFIGDEGLFSHLKRLLAADREVVEIHFLPLISTHGRDRNSIAREAQRAVQQTLHPLTEHPHQAAAA